MVGATFALTLAADSPAPDNADRGGSSTAAPEPSAQPASAKVPSPASPGPAAPGANASTQLAVRARDGFAFSADEYLPAGSAPRADVVLVPNLGQPRTTLAQLALAIRDRGFRVIAMDNVGQRRNLKPGSRGLPTFTPIDTSLLQTLVLDLTATAEKARPTPTERPLYVVGYGIGGNVALIYAGSAPDARAVALVLPGHDCEGFDPYDALALVSRRPALLVESEKRKSTDIGRVFLQIIESGHDPYKKRVVLPKEPPTSPSDPTYGQDVLLEWIDALPAAPRS